MRVPITRVSLLLLVYTFSFTSDKKPSVQTGLPFAQTQPSNMSRYQFLCIQHHLLVGGTSLFAMGKWPFLSPDLSLCTVPLTPRLCRSHISEVCSKSEKLPESFKFIQFVVGTRVDQALYKMLMYSLIIISSLRKDTWLKRRTQRKDAAFFACGYTLTYLCVNLSSWSGCWFSPSCSCWLCLWDFVLAKAGKESILIMLLVSDWIVENVLRLLIFVYIPGNYCLLKSYAKYTPRL